jgi:hypothetical protein
VNFIFDFALQVRKSRASCKYLRSAVVFLFAALAMLNNGDMGMSDFFAKQILAFLFNVSIELI